MDAMSSETEEILLLKSEKIDNYGGYIGVGTLFFDPSGGTLYAELDGTLYKWDLWKNQPRPEWWIRE